MKTVLVVDDEKLIRWALGEALRKSFVVRAAASADEALKVLGREAVDAVLTDLTMPGMNGMDFIQAVRERHPEVRIFALSACTDLPVTRQLREHGVLECFGKPFDMRAIQEALFRHLGPREFAPIP